MLTGDRTTSYHSSIGPPPAGAIQHTHLADSSPYVCVEAVEKGSPEGAETLLCVSHTMRAQPQRQSAAYTSIMSSLVHVVRSTTWYSGDENQLLRCV